MILDQLEIKVLRINLLSDVLEKLTKSITLYINLFDINNNFVDNFKNIIKKYEGKHQLKLNVFDSSTMSCIISKTNTLAYLLNNLLL